MRDCCKELQKLDFLYEIRIFVTQSVFTYTLYIKKMIFFYILSIFSDDVNKLCDVMSPLLITWNNSVPEEIFPYIRIYEF